MHDAVESGQSGEDIFPGWPIFSSIGMEAIMETHKAIIVVDLGFGDGGKGTIVDFLSRERAPSAVVRFNGGGQAAHNVVTPDGLHHTFSQFGSGTFVPGVQTHLSRFMLLDPFALVREAEHLTELGCGDPFKRLSIDEEAFVVTPFQKAANRIRETLRNRDRHGSCGMGIGETMADSLASSPLIVHARDLRMPDKLVRILARIQAVKYEEFKDVLCSLAGYPALASDIKTLNDPEAPALFSQALYAIASRFNIVSGSYLKELAKRGDLIFEGAQGVLLDEWYGFHPYTTWSTTTFANALTLLDEINYSYPVEHLGVLRAYFTRHGVGPFPTEDKELSVLLPDSHNGAGGWQGAFRVGWFDEVLARYALSVVGGIDSLAITNLDRFAAIPSKIRKWCSSYKLADKPLASSVLKLPPKTVLTDLAYQENLTRLLTGAIPVYEETAIDEVSYLRQIQARLRVPISILSYGPTAKDKQRALKHAPMSWFGFACPDV